MPLIIRYTSTFLTLAVYDRDASHAIFLRKLEEEA